MLLIEALPFRVAGQDSSGRTHRALGPQCYRVPDNLEGSKRIPVLIQSGGRGLGLPDACFSPLELDA